MGSSSPTRDGTRLGVQSYPLDHQEGPVLFLFFCTQVHEIVLGIKQVFNRHTLLFISVQLSFFLIFKFYLFYFWLFVAARGLSLVAASGAFSCRGARDSGHEGFSSCGLRALERRLSSCGAQA